MVFARVTTIQVELQAPVFFGRICDSLYVNLTARSAISVLKKEVRLQSIHKGSDYLKWVDLSNN